MLIRSQDKRAITTDLNMYVRENDFTRDKIKWEIRNSYQDVLATYSTEEKAIKVLDMIAEQYEAYSCRYGSDCSRYAVFQMPQDSEV